MKKRQRRNIQIIVGICFVIILTVAVLFALIGKKTSGRSADTQYNVQYIRTDGHVDGANYPKVTLIRSVSELKAYYETNKDNYDLGRGGAYASTPGFLDVYEGYDEAYFKTGSLVLVLLEEGSGSTRHNVTKVETSGAGNNTEVKIHIERKKPDIGTCDMAVWHLLIELPADIRVTDEERITVYLDGVDRTKETGTIECKRGYANMRLTTFKGWEFEVIEGNEGEAPIIGISFWPEGKSGKVSLEYWGNQWGVCGTGLKSEKIKIGSYEAQKGIYDENPVWEFIAFEGTPGAYIARNLGASAWWDEFGDEAMEILGTARLASTVISENQAISMALQKSGKSEKDCREIIAEFDYDNGSWMVEMYTDENVRITVVVDNNGNVYVPEE